MSTLKLSLSIEHSEVLLGGGIPAQAALTNAGSVPVDVPSPDGASELQYRVRAAGGDRPERLLSHEQAYAERTLEPRPESDVPREPLAAGAQMVYAEDVGSYAIPPLEVGEYLLSVRLGQRESDAVPLTVVQPAVGAVTTVTGSGGELGLGFVHHGDGEELACQVESRSDRPGDGAAQRRAVGEHFDGVAVAADLEWCRGVRWFAWLSGGAVAATVAKGIRLYVEVAPVPLGLSQATLSPVGWQPERNEATFVALGLDANGQRALAVVALDARAREGAVKIVPLGGDLLPARWAAQYDPGDGTPSLWLVYVHEPAAADGADTPATSGGVRVEAQRVSLTTGKATPPVVLSERGERLAALAVPPVVPEGGPRVDLLRGPSGAGRLMRFERLGLARVAAPKPHKLFAAPADERGARPDAWALAPRGEEDPHVLAKLGERLLAGRLGEGPAWRLLVALPADACQLRLETPTPRPVAIWVEGKLGLRFAELP